MSSFNLCFVRMTYMLKTRNQLLDQHICDCDKLRNNDIVHNVCYYVSLFLYMCQLIAMMHAHLKCYETIIRGIHEIAPLHKNADAHPSYSVYAR